MDQTPAFRPVNMTLESIQEASHLMKALSLYQQYHASDSPEALFAKGILDWFSRNLQIEPDRDL